MMDATYNPLSMNEDFFFPQAEGGRGSSVETLPGGTQLGEITDLRFFTNKMFRGLRIPASYLPTQTDEAQNIYSDGKATIASIQEFRFNKYCERLQNLVIDPLDREFKLFLRFRGINIDSGLFSLRFNEPQNFTAHRQVAMDAERISNFQTIEGFPYVSKRYALKRYLGWSEEEMQENEDMWAEEQKDSTAPTVDLRSVGVTPGGISADMDMAAPPAEGDGDMGAEGGEAMGGEPAGASPAAAPPLGANGGAPGL